MRGLEQIPWLYDLGLSFMERGWLGRARRWLVAGTRGRTLELGAGTGRDLPLYPSGQPVIALDPHPQNIDAARRRAPSVPHVRARAEALPFRDGSFDTVVSSLVFCSVDDPAAGLAEIRRVLRPGGRLRMLEHVRSRRRFSAWLQDVGQPGWTWVTGGCRPNRDTERLVREEGFKLDPASRESRGAFRRFEALLLAAALLLPGFALAAASGPALPPADLPAPLAVGTDEPAALYLTPYTAPEPPGFTKERVAESISAEPEPWFDLPHAFVERRIFDVVNGFDRFFADERDVDKLRSNSFLRVRSEARVDRDGKAVIATSFRADLSLPYLEKRLRRFRVLIEDAGRALGETAVGAPTGGTNGHPDAVLRFTLLEAIRSSMDLGGGVLLAMPPGLVGRLRFRHVHELGPVAIARFALVGFWNTADHFGSNATLSFEHALAPRLLLRWTNASVITQRSNGFQSGSELALLANVGKYTAITVLGSAAVPSRPELVVQSWRVAARLRTSLYSRWIFGEVEPEVTWPLDAAGGRRAVPAVVFRIEVQFEERPPAARNVGALPPDAPCLADV